LFTQNEVLQLSHAGTGRESGGSEEVRQDDKIRYDTYDNNFFHYSGSTSETHRVTDFYMVGVCSAFGLSSKGENNDYINEV